uniref:Vitamin B12 import ATP-binding protein BtuD n=1 Tax=Candidatus Methanophagaceae archaeon ANME-1 ERB6 TaxID=2759912 RepID=A0A7G9YZW0_9EURY|nr:vitamin B12 import ATP-binding protein BtuD [Methanosarcinales archaeon ANME-1 ERB6]
MIKTENLTKVYNGKKAVDDLNLEIAEGDIFGFLGPNGAGKSTTILMLVGLIEPTEGKCFINDIEVARNPLKVKELIGYLPENVGFYGNMTAEQNLDYFARFYPMDADERKTRIEELLELVQLDSVSQKVGGYSRGMTQRLGFAQALLNNPGVIFLDEPTTNLDPEGVLQLRQTLKKLSDEGKTIFFSSHILAEVAQVCNTIGIISNGTLIERGTLDEVKTKLDVRKTVKIIVEATEDMPKIEHENIIDVEYKGRKAVIEAKSDIREYISRYLLENNVGIKELRIEEPTLEDVFMESVYKGKGGK